MKYIIDQASAAVWNKAHAEKSAPLPSHFQAQQASTAVLMFVLTSPSCLGTLLTSLGALNFLCPVDHVDG